MTRTLHGIAARILVVDGPLDGCRESAVILRGCLRCPGGEYRHALPIVEPLTLVWVADPIIVVRRTKDQVDP